MTKSFESGTKCDTINLANRPLLERLTPYPSTSSRRAISSGYGFGLSSAQSLLARDKAFSWRIRSLTAHAIWRRRAKDGAVSGARNPQLG